MLLLPWCCIVGRLLLIASHNARRERLHSLATRQQWVQSARRDGGSIELGQESLTQISNRLHIKLKLRINGNRNKSCVQQSATTPLRRPGGFVQLRGRSAGSRTACQPTRRTRRAVSDNSSRTRPLVDPRSSSRFARSGSVELERGHAPRLHSRLTLSPTRVISIDCHPGSEGLQRDAHQSPEMSDPAHQDCLPVIRGRDVRDTRGHHPLLWRHEAVPAQGCE
jgi:hypothetical protein